MQPNTGLQQRVQAKDTKIHILHKPQNVEFWQNMDE